MISINQEFENINFKCISLNVRGLNKSRKRRKIFRWLHQQNTQIVLLQETYSTKKVENKWKTEWGGQMLFSHGSNYSKGIMILIKPSFDIEIKRSIQDKQGRCIILEAKVYESNFIFVNISGLEINKSKTEALWLGKWKDRKDKPLGFKWSENPILALGVYFSYDKVKSDKCNFEEKLDKLEKTLNILKANTCSFCSAHPRGLCTEGKHPNLHFYMERQTTKDKKSILIGERKAGD